MNQNIYCPTCGRFVCEIRKDGPALSLRHPCQHCRTNLLLQKAEDALIRVVTQDRNFRLDDLPQPLAV